MRRAPDLPPMTPLYSLVVPIHNAEAVLPVLLHRLDALLARLDGQAEVIFVDDGSRDASPIALEAKARMDARYRFVKLSRKFGHEFAITAGMERAAGQAVVVMDADPREPPEVVLELVAKWKEGYEVIYAQRLSRPGRSRIEREMADLFHHLIGTLGDVEIPPNVGEVRLVDRKALDEFLAMPERDRFLRGMLSWIGFRQAVVAFPHSPRAAGESNPSLTKMIRLAVSELVSFSDAPLRVALWAGFGVCACAMLYGLWTASLWALGVDLARGWSSTILVATFLGGADMLMTGVLGVYIGRIHTEVKRRPLFVVDRAVGFEAAAEAAPSRKPLIAEARRA